MKHHKLTIMNLISAAFLPALLFICAAAQQKSTSKDGNRKEAKAPMFKHK